MRLTIQQKFGLAIFLSLLGVSVIAFNSIGEKLSALKAERRLNQLANLGLHAVDLVHELQRERGLSAIFISSAGKSQKTQLDKQRLQTQKAVEQYAKAKIEILQSFSEKKLVSFTHKIDAVETYLNDLELKRKDIDSLTVGNQIAFGYFTDTIQFLVRLTAAIVVVSPDAAVSTAIVPYVALMEANEAFAQERGMGAGVIASGRFSQQALAKMYMLRGQQQALHQDFLAYAGPIHRSFFDQVIRSVESQKIEELRLRINQAGVSGDLRGLTASKWFDTFSRYLSSMWNLEKLLSKNIMEVSNRVQRKALMDLYSTVFVTLLFVATLFFFIFTIRGFTSPMLIFARSMEKLSRGHIDVEIPDVKGGNELEKMAQAMQTFQKSAMERNQIVDELEAAKRRADSANQAKGDFLATMSHEIRTPMNGVLSCTNLLLDSVKDKEERRLLKTIESCGDTLLTLINDILDFSKVESGKLQLEEQPFDFRYNINQIVDLLSHKASEKGVVVSQKVDGAVPDWVSGDVTRFRQVLTNLMGNAIKFTKDKVDVSISAKEMDAGRFEITTLVKDNGIGISEDGQKKLFKSFSQVDTSTTRKFGGTGLGLVICKGLTTAMGGQIWVESELHKGSVFGFTVVLRKVADGEQKEKKMISEINPNMGTDHPLKILMAEDNSVNQLVAKKMFLKLGYRIDIAANGIEAINMLKQKKYDIIFMDQHMPEMDGIKATQVICRDWSSSERPRIVALTASAFGEDKKRCLDAGMDAFLTKPVRAEDLVTELLKCEK